MILTGAGLVEEISSGNDQLRGKWGEKRTSCLGQRVVNLLLQNVLGELRLRVEEDQLPPPLPLLHLWWRHILVVGGNRFIRGYHFRDL